MAQPPLLREGGLFACPDRFTNWTALPGSGGVARSAGVVACPPSAAVLCGRLCATDHPVRSFQSRTPLLYQEGSFARRNNFGCRGLLCLADENAPVHSLQQEVGAATV